MAEARTLVPTLVALAEQGHQNLESYASQVRVLEFAGDDCDKHELFQDIDFSNLERVEIDASDKNEEHLLTPYLQPSLKAFFFYGGPISDNFLDKLQKSCPALEELLIDSPRDLISPQGFLKFLNDAQSLKHITVMYGMDKVLDDAVLIALATRPGLETLKFTKPFTSDLILRAEDYRRGSSNQQEQQPETRKPFPALRVLACQTDASGLEALLVHAPHLRYLEATIVENEAPQADTAKLLALLTAYCDDLQFLSLECTQSQTKPRLADELVKLTQKLTNIHDLHLNINSEEPTDLQDRHVSQLAVTLPGLKTLELEFRCNLTHAALLDLGNHCGGTLTACQLGSIVDLFALEGRKNLFPQLEELRLEGIDASRDDEKSAVEAVVGILKDVMPNLRDFSVLGEGRFGNEVSRRWIARGG